jgi:hypothetical protein
MKKLSWIAVLVAGCLAVPTVFADDKDKDSKQSASCARLSQVIGSKVESQNNESLGKIHELVVQNGQIQFAVLGVGGVLGIGEKMAPVPWKALNYSGEKGFTLNVDKQKLQSAPTLQKDQWSQLDSPTFTSQLYSFYGVQAPEAAGGTGSQSSTESKSKSSEKSQDKDKDKDKDKE